MDPETTGETAPRAEPQNHVENSPKKSSSASFKPAEADQIIESAAKKAADIAQAKGATAAPIAKAGDDWLKEAQERASKMRPLPPPPEPTSAEIAARLEERRRRIAYEAKIPPRYLHAAPWQMQKLPEDVREQAVAVFERLRRLVSDPITLGLIGPRGCGKTHMAAALCFASAGAGKSSLYATAMDFFVAVKSTFSRDAKVDQTDVEKKYLAPHLLILDEVHERSESVWENQMFTRLIDQRYANLKSTLLISNQDQQTFTQCVGTSIADRMNDGGGIVSCSFKSLRGRVDPASPLPRYEQNGDDDYRPSSRGVTVFSS